MIVEPQGLPRRSKKSSLQRCQEQAVIRKSPQNGTLSKDKPFSAHSCEELPKQSGALPVCPQDHQIRGQTNHNVVGRHHEQSEWWSQTGSNRRPHACKARALPTELWPHVVSYAITLPQHLGGLPRDARSGKAARTHKPNMPRATKSKIWWAEEDLNLRPHAYQACALTT